MLPDCMMLPDCLLLHSLCPSCAITTRVHELCTTIHTLDVTFSWGVQGKTLTNSVKQIFTDFQTAAEKFQKLNYDAMNVDATQFTDDFAVFCGVIRELERRLGAVIAQVCM